MAVALVTVSPASSESAGAAWRSPGKVGDAVWRGRDDIVAGDVTDHDALDDPALSRHLRSRHEVGRVLADGPVPVTELRAALIIGSGSASFEMLLGPFTPGASIDRLSVTMPDATGPGGGGTPGRCPLQPLATIVRSGRVPVREKPS